MAAWLHHAVPEHTESEKDGLGAFWAVRRSVLARPPLFAVVELLTATAAESASAAEEERFFVSFQHGTADSLRNNRVPRVLRAAESHADADALFCSIHREWTSPLKRYVPQFVLSPIGGVVSSPAPLVNPAVAALLGALYDAAAAPLLAHGVDWLGGATPASIDRAVLVLLQMRDLLASGGDLCGAAGQRLEREFFATLPTEIDRTVSAAAQRIGTAEALEEWLEACEVMRDVLDVGECGAIDLATTDADVLYSALGCDIVPLSEGCQERCAVERTLGKQQQIRVANVFRVCRRVEVGVFADELGNTQLLCHGSRTGNILGILARGLLLPQIAVAQFGVHRTNAGNLGRGIYFASDAAASIKYTTDAGSPRFLLLCDVALGRVLDTNKAMPDLTDAPQGYNSVHAIGGSCEVFPDDEFAVYSPRQQRLRYLVEFSTTEAQKERPVVSEKSKISMLLGQTDQPSASSSVPASATPAVAKPKPAPSSKLGMQTATGTVVLEAVNVKARIVDSVCEYTIFQQFFNTGSTEVEAKYNFPSEETTAVTGFEVFINQKHLVGVVKEKEQARQEYEEAVERGDGAYLLDESDANLFTIAIGNVPARTRVVLVVSCITEIQLSGNARKFVWPASMTAGQKAAGSSLTQTATRTVTTSADKSRFQLSIGVSMPQMIHRVVSPTHSILVKHSSSRATIKFAENAFPSKDFVLLIHANEPRTPSLWIEAPETSDSSEFAAMVTLYPDLSKGREPDPSSTEFLLLLDCSNSMRGCEELLLRAAGVLLSAVPQFSRFNVIPFGSTFEPLFLESVVNDKHRMEAAQRKLRSLHAQWGSSNLWVALRSVLFAIEHKARDAGPTAVFVLTDGDVSNEGAVMRLVREHSAKENCKTRIFTVGLGSAPHRHNITSIARLGNGQAEFVGVGEDPQEALIRQMSRATQPSLGAISVKWGSSGAGPAVRQAPTRVSSLFDGERTIIYGFFSSVVDSVTISANDSSIGAAFSQLLPANPATTRRGCLVHRLAARAAVREWIDGSAGEDMLSSEHRKLELKGEIVQLGVLYSLATPLTSFITVEDRTGNEGEKLPTPDIEKVSSSLDVDEIPHCSLWQKISPEEAQQQESAAHRKIGQGKIIKHPTVFDFWEPAKPEVRPADTFYRHWLALDHRPRRARGPIPKALSSKPVLLEITEVQFGGEEQFTAMRDMMVRHADVVVYAFSLTNASSLYALNECMSEFERIRDSGQDVPAVLAGFKADLIAEREVTQRDAQELASAHDMPYIEVSSKARINVDRLVQLACKELFTLQGERFAKSKSSAVELRVLLAGMPAVGKRAFIVMHTQNCFCDQYDPTIEDSYRKQIVFEDAGEEVEVHEKKKKSRKSKTKKAEKSRMANKHALAVDFCVEAAPEPKPAPAPSQAPRSEKKKPEPTPTPQTAAMAKPSVRTTAATVRRPPPRPKAVQQAPMEAQTRGRFRDGDAACYMSYGGATKCRSHKQKCFIATAAYGTPFNAHLDSLRWFRDHCMPQPLVGFYYRLSPHIACRIRKCPTAQLAVRTVLWPIVAFIEHPISALLAFFALFVAMAFML